MADLRQNAPDSRTSNRAKSAHSEDPPTVLFKRNEEPAGSFDWAAESATWAVAATIYTGWLAATWYCNQLPVWLVLPAGAFLVAWHGSLQHEVLHGHPTPWSWLNSCLGFLPLGLLFPFPVYRNLHLQHHRVPYLTDPIEDTESYYVTAESWSRLSRAEQCLLKINNTLLGRVFIGPALVAAHFLRSEFMKIVSGNREHLIHWLVHILAVSLVLWWVMGVCGISFLKYLFCFAYPGAAITLVRSFAEHRPADQDGQRSAIVEAAPGFSLLYLNNNLHYVHHKHPGMPWYRIAGEYRRIRPEVLKANGGYLFRGYSEVFRKYFFKMKDSPVFPGR